MCKLETTTIANETCCVKYLEHFVLMEEVSNMVDLWHKRLAHLNHKGVHYFSTNSLAIGFPILLLLQTIYEGCQLGKQRRESPRSTSSHSNAIFDLIQVPSFGLSHSLMVLVVILRCSSYDKIVKFFHEVQIYN